MHLKHQLLPMKKVTTETIDQYINMLINAITTKITLIYSLKIFNIPNKEWRGFMNHSRQNRKGMLYSRKLAFITMFILPIKSSSKSLNVQSSYPYSSYIPNHSLPLSLH